MQKEKFVGSSFSLIRIKLVFGLQIDLCVAVQRWNFICYHEPDSLQGTEPRSAAKRNHTVGFGTRQAISPKFFGNFLPA
jgi:hypothetical protein